jgi:hypothetical protein
LQKHGHEVTALVRADPEVVAGRGATPAVVDLYDRPSVVRLLRDADAAVHTASPGDASRAELDSAVADAAIEAFDGTGKPYIHISRAWVYGDNASITEESPSNTPALVAWREPIERRVLGASDMRGVVIVSGVAYGAPSTGTQALMVRSLAAPTVRRNSSYARSTKERRSAWLTGETAAGSRGSRWVGSS